MKGTIQGTFGVIQGTFGVIQGTFGVIQGTFGVIQGTCAAASWLGRPRTSSASPSAPLELQTGNIPLKGTIQGTFGMIQRTFGVIQGTFGVILGTFGVIQGKYRAHLTLASRPSPLSTASCLAPVSVRPLMVL
jgi:hypothetical protein